MVKFFRRPSFFYTLLVAVPHLFFYIILVIIASWTDRVFFRESFKASRIGKLSLKVRNSWLKGILNLHGLVVQPSGPFAQHVKEYKGAVFVSNHQSIVDILVTMYLLPDNVSFVAKKELEQIPLFGWAARAIGVIFIDREKGTNNKSLKDVTTYLQSGGSVLFYPEGTRSSDGNLLPFKRGAFVLAILSQAPIVPISVRGSKETCPKKSLAIAPGIVTVHIDDPIPTEGLTEETRFQLADKVKAVISKNL